MPKNEKKNLMVFGYGLAIILALIGRHIYKHHGMGWIHGVLGVAILTLMVVTSVNYRWLLPFYKRWMQVAQAIGHVVTGIILSILFYGVFGVVGLILRLLRKDLLEEEIDHAQPTYWHKRPSKAFVPEDCTKQY